MFRLSSLFPYTCVLCDAPANHIDLCNGCFEDLPWISHPCRQCGLPLSENSWGLCPKCQSKPGHFSAVLAPFSYQFPVDVMISRFKQHRQLAFGQVLGELLSDHVIKLMRAIEDDDNLIVPVPLHAKRQRQRGFNQAMILADILARKSSWPLLPKLCRRVHEGGQAKLQKLASRAHAVKDVFEVQQAINSQRIIIVDDVVTSCATANELSKLLLKAGAADVVVVAAARTPSNTL